VSFQRRARQSSFAYPLASPHHTKTPPPTRLANAIGEALLFFLFFFSRHVLIGDGNSYLRFQ